MFQIFHFSIKNSDINNLIIFFASYCLTRGLSYDRCLISLITITMFLGQQCQFYNGWENELIVQFFEMRKLLKYFTEIWLQLILINE